jgi:oligopeptide transport system substrate-binding protein
VPPPNLRLLLRYVTSAVVVLLAVSCAREPEDVKNPDVATADTRADSPRTLVRALGGEPGSLDPRLAADNPSLTLMIDLYEGLTREAADGTLVPGAAESWHVSDDGTVWSFKLRPGLQWSDGQPLEALHFAQGIAEAKATGSGAPYAPLLAGIRSITVAPGGAALSLHLWRPMPQLAAILALPVAAPERATDENVDSFAGNGPYRLASRAPGERVVLERNAHYHGRDDVSVGRVTWLTLEDLNTELNLYRAGRLQVTSEVPNARIAWIREHLPGQLQVTPFLSTYGYAVNVARLGHVEARTALAMAIDRERITRLVTGAGERPAYGWVPPGLFDYPNARFGWAGVDAAGRLAQARALWQTAADRGTAPPRLTLCTDASENHRRTAIALIDQWHTALDVDVELLELEWKSYLAERERPGRCDLVRLGWSADYADAEAFLELFESRHPQNTQGYSSARYDTLLYESRRAGNARERLQRLSMAEQVLLEEMPVIPVFHRVTKRLVKPDVLGASEHPLGHLATRQLRWRDPDPAAD